MSLYLCVFQGDREVAGVEAGSYADFNALRSYVVNELENAVAGSRFPVFILHSDSDGEWPLKDCAGLRDELATVIEAMKNRPALRFPGPRNALESFVDIEGQPLPESLHRLAEMALICGQPILFQ